MKKLAFIISVFTFASLCINAQSIEIYNIAKNKKYVNGDTLEFFISSYTKKYEQMLVTIKNVNESHIRVNLKQTILSRVEGAYYSFCWGTCYQDNGEDIFVGDSDMAVSVNSGEFTDEACIFDYVANNKGVSYVRYTFFNQDNMNDTTCIIVKYSDAKVDITEIENTQIAVYPNPAQKYLNVKVNGSHGYTIKIFNLLGSEIYESQAVEGNNTINLSDWNGGIYFCSFCRNGMILKTEKFILSK